MCPRILYKCKYLYMILYYIPIIKISMSYSASMLYKLRTKLKRIFIFASFFYILKIKKTRPCIDINNCLYISK